MQARDIMIREYDCIRQTATIKEAVVLFKKAVRGEGKKGVNALMVVDENDRLVGLITMSHILKTIIPFYMELGPLSGFAWEGLFERMCRKVQNKKVSEFMERKVLTIPPDMNIIKIVDLMLKNRVRRLPVVEGGKIVGIVYRKDIFFKIVENMLDKEERQ